MHMSHYELFTSYMTDKYKFSFKCYIPDRTFLMSNDWFDSSDNIVSLLEIFDDGLKCIDK